MQLKEVMTTDVQVISPDATLADAGMTMRDGDLGMLPVGENDRLIGTVADRFSPEERAEAETTGGAVGDPMEAKRMDPEVR